MRIVLIGASGFVGSRLIGVLKKEGHTLLNIDKNPSLSYPDITETGDVRNIDSFSAFLKGADMVVLLAAEHKDNVSPVSLYYDVNVEGMRNVLSAMDSHDIRRMLFVSSVAIYGLNKQNPSEDHPADPFNHYGKSKWQAEQLLREWHELSPGRKVDIIRPTVIFGEGNRGNVYNLLKQICSGRFMMVGKGNNKKSMAYIGNAVAFIDFLINKDEKGYEVYNYADKPDFSMNELVALVSRVRNKFIPSVHVPYALGLFGGFCLDMAAKLTGKKFPVSKVRVQKFCATTQFDFSKGHATGFVAPYTLEEGLTRTLEFEFKDDGSNRE